MTNTKNELLSAMDLVVTLADCGSFSHAYPIGDLYGRERTDLVCVQLVNNARISKAAMIEKGRALRAALRAAGFKMTKATVDCSWHMGRPADWKYNFRVGV